MVGPGAVADVPAGRLGHGAGRIEDSDLAQAARLRRRRDGGEEAALGEHEQPAVEAELDLDPPAGEGAAAGPRRELEDRALEADAAVGSDRAPPAEGADPAEVEVGRDRAPGRDVAGGRHREAAVEAGQEAAQDRVRARPVGRPGPPELRPSLRAPRIVRTEFSIVVFTSSTALRVTGCESLSP